MIKLAFCTDGIFPESIGGMQRHSRLLLEELAKYDIDITVFHPHQKKKLFSGCTNITEIQIPGINQNKNYLKESYVYSQKIYGWLKNMPEHIVYSQGLSVWHGIGKLNNCIIGNPHGLEPYQALGFKDKLIALPFKLVFAHIFKKADYVVSLGGRLTDILQRIVSEKKIIVLPNGVNLPKSFKNITKPKSPVCFLFVGRFASNKGIDLLLKSVSELNDEGYAETIFFKLAGKGPLWETLQKEYPLSNVEFLGFVSDKQLLELYASCHAFVLPTLFEGMPTVVLEAMTYSLPIIVTDVGATTELVDSTNGYIIERNNQTSLKNGIKNFVDLDNAKRKQLGQNSLQRVKQKFLWSIIAEKHYRFFCEQTHRMTSNQLVSKTSESS